MEQHGSERERVQDRSKRPPRGINMAPRETQSVTLKKADFRETLLQGNMTQIDSQEMHQERPRAGQERAKSGQERPKSGQERPKSSQEQPKSGPRAARGNPRTARSGPKVPKSGPRVAKSAPRGHQQATKSLRATQKQ